VEAIRLHEWGSSGCAKGDYRFGSDARYPQQSTLTTPTGSSLGGFGKSAGTVIGMHQMLPRRTLVRLVSYACYSVFMPLTVSTVNSQPASRTPGSGCEVQESAQCYWATLWAVYTNDSAVWKRHSPRPVRGKLYSFPQLPGRDSVQPDHATNAVSSGGRCYVLQSEPLLLRCAHSGPAASEFW